MTTRPAPVSARSALAPSDTFPRRHIGPDEAEVGRTLKEHESFGTVESVKAVSELFSPVAGEVVEHNAALVASPEVLNADPYGKAWMIKVRLSDPGAVASLMDAAAYGKYVESEAK